MWKAVNWFRRLFEWAGNIGTAQGIPEQVKAAWKLAKRVWVVASLAYAVFAPLPWYWKVPIAVVLLWLGLLAIEKLSLLVERIRRGREPVLAFRGVCGTARWDGKQLRSADLVIENTGHPFTLVALAKIVNSAPGLDFLETDEWRYEAREVRGGKDRTSFHIATVEQTNKTDAVVSVRAEHMLAVSAWTVRQPNTWFDVRWTLMRDVESVLSEIGVVTTRVMLAPDLRAFEVVVDPSGNALPPIGPIRQVESGASSVPSLPLVALDAEHPLAYPATVATDQHQASERSATPAVEVSWVKHSTGLIVRGRSKSPDILRGVNAILVGIELWSAEHERYVMLPQHYPKEKFTRLILLGRADMGLGDTVDFTTVSRGPDRVDIAGNGPRVVLDRAGTWRLWFKVFQEDKLLGKVALCLRWDGDKNIPSEEICPIPKA